MKKLLFILASIALLASCKKEDDPWLTYDGSGEQITCKMIDSTYQKDISTIGYNGTITTKEYTVLVLEDGGKVAFQSNWSTDDSTHLSNDYLDGEICQENNFWDNYSFEDN